MKFMMIVKCTEAELGKPPAPELLEKIHALAAQGAKDGTMLATGGLGSTKQGARVTTPGGKVKVVDGPFSETKELIGGFAIMELPSLEEAKRTGASFMQLHVDVLGPSYNGHLEIRPLEGFQDFTK